MASKLSKITEELREELNGQMKATLTALSNGDIDLSDLNPEAELGADRVPVAPLPSDD